MANTICLNAIGSTFQDELRSGFAFQVGDQEDEGDVLFHPMQEAQHLRFLPVRTGVLSHDNVKELGAESFGELRWSHNYIRADRKSHPLEFMTAALNVCQGTMNKEDAHEILSAPKRGEDRSTFHLLRACV